MTVRPVYVLGTGRFLPGAPIKNDELMDVLGPINGAPERVAKFTQGLGRRVLEQSGIETRYLAIDRETHDLTHSLVDLAAEACRVAMADADVGPDEIDLLVLSQPTYEYSTPPGSAILQERLGIDRCAEFEIHSNCSGVGKSVQIAYDALRLGRYRTALVVYSQLSSVYLRDCYFNQAKMDKVHAALRLILADGAGAMVLRGAEGGPADTRHTMLGTYVESVGGKRPAGMTAGGGVADLMKHEPTTKFYERGDHHLWQDLAAVARDASPLLGQGIMRFTRELNIKSGEIDHYVISAPTYQLYKQGVPPLAETLNVGMERIKFRSGRLGYTGGASIVISLDEMAKNGELQPGQRIICHSIESSKWMTAGFCVHW